MYQVSQEAPYSACFMYFFVYSAFCAIFHFHVSYKCIKSSLLMIEYIEILFAAPLHTKVYSSKPVGAQTLRETGVDAK